MLLAWHRRVSFFRLRRPGPSAQRGNVTLGPLPWTKRVRSCEGFCRFGESTLGSKARVDLADPSDRFSDTSVEMLATAPVSG